MCENERGDKREKDTDQPKESIKEEIKDADQKEDLIYILIKHYPGPATIAFFVLLAIIIGQFTYAGSKLAKVNENYELLNQKISELPSKEEYEELKAQIDEQQKIISGYNNFENIRQFYPDITIEVNTIDNTVSYSNAPLIIGRKSIFYDLEGVKYVSEDLIGETILLTYTEEDKEVYFLGQYNENYHWNGYCVTNAYNSDGTLYGLCESNFIDGERQDYTSFYQVGSEYIYAHRVKNGELFEGVTVRYCYEDTDGKAFSMDNVRSTDINYVDSYIREKGIDKIRQIYTGTTNQKYYQDNSGDAYRVRFDDEGYVTSLYKGRFADGYGNDETLKAYAIEYNDNYKGYFLNENTVFENGKASEKSTHLLPDDELDKMTSNIDMGKYTSYLKWKR